MASARACVELGVGERPGRGGGDRIEAGRQPQGGAAQGGAGEDAAEPGARADARAEIDDEIEVARAAAARPGFRSCAGAERRIEGERGGSAAGTGPDLVELVQSGKSPRDP